LQQKKKVDPDKLAKLRDEKLLKGKFAYLSGIKTNGTTRRFYVSVGVEKVEEGYAVKLGQQYIVTQAGNKLVVPTLGLAELLAVEWDSQVEFIRPTSMPLTKLAVTAIDQMGTEQGRQKAIQGLLNHLRADQTLHRASAPATLVKLQKKHHDPLLDFLREQHGIELKLARGIEMEEQPPESMEKMARLLSLQNNWVLAALDSIATLSNSLVVAWNLYADNIDLEQAYEAARCDENYQIRQYGELRGQYGHGVDIEYAKQQIAAARTFLNMLEEHGAFRTEGEVVTAFEYEHRPPAPAVLYKSKYKTIGELKQARKERAELRKKMEPLQQAMRQAMMERIKALRQALLEGKDPLASRLESEVNSQLEEYDKQHPTRLLKRQQQQQQQEEEEGAMEATEERDEQKEKNS